jgi:hypothetical protein
MSFCQVQNHEFPVEPLMLATAATSTYSSMMAAAHRMARDLDQERASRLAMEAVNLADAGQVEVGEPSLLGDAWTLLIPTVRKHRANFAKQPL